MPNKNWFDRLFNPYDFAYAYAEVDPVIEDKKEEEELFKQFFEFRIGKFFRRVTRPIDRAINYVKKKAINTVKDVTGVTKAENEIKRANAEAEAEAKKARDEYNKVSSQINKDIASREAKAAATKASQDKEIAAWKTKASTAQASAARSAKEGAAKVAYAKKQRGATESKIQQQKLAKKAAELAAAKQATKSKAAGQPGIATTTVKAIGGLGGTGKTGSAKAKTKGTKDKPGRLVIG